MIIKHVTSVVALSAFVLFTGGHAWADSLELVDGEVLEGDFIGSSNGIIMFKVGDDIEAYPEDKVVGVYLGAGVEARETREQTPDITIPAGTPLVIRMTDSIDSKRHQPGHRFRGQLESALVVDGNTVVPRGTFVYGRIVEASASGRLGGSAELSIEFTELMIDDQLIPITTANLRAQGSSEGARTIGRTARAAAIGGLIDGSSGAKTGAKVGAGASLITSGSSLSVPAGTMIDTELRAPVTLQD